MHRNIIIALALLAAVTCQLKAGVNILCSYTPQVNIPNDGVIHNYGPWYTNTTPYPLYLTAIQLNARSFAGTSAIVACQFFNNKDRLLTYFSGAINSDTQFPIVQFAPNYVELAPGDSLGMYVQNVVSGSSMSAFFAIWFSYAEP
jgi:hypothetical protein